MTYKLIEFCNKFFYILINLFCRLLNSFAEEQAIEDAIYYLGEALRKSVIESDVFLKVKMLFIIWVKH